MAKPITGADLRRYQADVVAWAEECLWSKDPMTGTVGPLHLQDHQRNFLREATRRGDDGHFAYKVAVASYPKREGKTWTVAIILAWRLACFANQRVGILANSERQAASNVFDAVSDFFSLSPKLEGLVPDDAFQTKKLTVPALGNVVECFPCNHRTIQGTRFDVLACDELHASDDGGKAYTFASQQTEAVDAQVLISSQAGAPVDSNPMFLLYRASKTEKHVFFDYRQEPVTPWAASRAAKAKSELTPGEYSYLWENCWGATGMKLFSPAAVQRAARSYRMPQSSDQWRDLLRSWGWGSVSIGFGLDRAGVSVRGDRSVITVSACWTPPDADPLYAVVLVETLYTGAEAEVLATYRKTVDIFGHPDGITLETYGCSDLVEKIPKAELQAPTTAKQQTIYNRLYRLFDEGRIRFPEDAGYDHQKQVCGLLNEELINFGYDCEKAGATKFKTQSGHDDHVDSLAWSIDSIADRDRSHGPASVSLINTKRRTIMDR